MLRTLQDPVLRGLVDTAQADRFFSNDRYIQDALANTPLIIKIKYRIPCSRIPVFPHMFSGSNITYNEQRHRPIQSYEDTLNAQ